MSEQLQLRRGTSAQLASFLPQQGEVVVDTDHNRAVVGDGLTTGGWPAAKLAETITNTRVSVGDAAYGVQATDRMICYTSITAPRVVSLLAASAYPTGTRLLVVDESGACSTTNTITLTRAGSYTINGATTAAIAMGYGFIGIESNGSNAWTILDTPPGSPAGVLPIASGGSGVAPKSLAYSVAAAAINANAVADTAIAIPLPAGFTKYRVRSVTALNPSVSLTAAYGALYTAASGGGVAVCAPQALSGLTTNAANSVGNGIDMAQALANATFFTAATLYFRITTAQGAAATVDLVIRIESYE